MPDGGRCLNVYVSREGQRDHLGHFRVEDRRRTAAVLGDLQMMSREADQLLFRLLVR